VAIPDRDFVIAAEYTTIAAIGREREVWESERIACDGILLDSTTPEELRGKVWCIGGWYAFTLRFEGWVYNQGEFLTDRWDSFANLTT
jgi:hypothetical protein